MYLILRYPCGRLVGEADLTSNVKLQTSNLSLCIKILQFICNRSKESCTQTSIYNPVIVTHREIHHMSDCNTVAVRSFNNYWSFFDGTNSKYGYLWLIDDGSTHQAPKRPDIGKRECTVCNVFRF